MDLLFSKYASPFTFVDGMIRTGRFSEFVDEFMELEAERKTWEIWLHKVFDKSYNDFESSLSVQEAPSKKQIETTVNDSKSILKSFIPNE